MTISLEKLKDNCSICQSSLKGPAFEEGDDFDLTMSKCDHLFHKTCLQKHVEFTSSYMVKCPNCRKYITDITIIKLIEEPQEPEPMEIDWWPGQPSSKQDPQPMEID